MPAGGLSGTGCEGWGGAWGQAAVKALAWSPHQHGLLASGGGTADQHIRFWNTSSGTPLTSVNTGSQALPPPPPPPHTHTHMCTLLGLVTIGVRASSQAVVGLGC